VIEVQLISRKESGEEGKEGSCMRGSSSTSNLDVLKDMGAKNMQ
jgi:hypothetical protein